MWTCETQPILLLESNFVCIQSFRAVDARVYFINLQFLAFFGPRQTQEGVWPYRHS